MNYSKIREVKSPSRGTSKSAGIDFYIPKFTESFVNDLRTKNNQNFLMTKDEIYLGSQERILIPSGIKVKIPEGYMLKAANKSGVSTKKGLDVLAGVIDEDYEGEIGISLYNTSSSSICLKEDEKIIQFILIPVSYDIMNEVPIEELFKNSISERKDRGYGSTDNL